MEQSEAKRNHIFLYVFAASKQDHLYQLQMESLAPHQDDSIEHDIVITEVLEHGHGILGQAEFTGDRCHELEQRYDIQPGHFKVVLVGRDSDVKLCSESCVSYEEVVMRLENIPHKITTKK